MQLGHPKVALDLVVGEGDREVVEEPEHLVSVLVQPSQQVAVQRFAADLAPPETYRYRLALARTAEQASRIAQFDAGEAAQIVDENSAVVLVSAARTWESWMARFMRARGKLHVIEGGQ